MAHILVYCLPVCFYSVISGLPGINKSSAISLFNNQLDKAETTLIKAKQIKSRFINNSNRLDDLHLKVQWNVANYIQIQLITDVLIIVGGSLLNELRKSPRKIQFWDEFETLVSSFGLYKSGGGGSHDRSFFLTLNNIYITIIII